MMTPGHHHLIAAIKAIHTEILSLRTEIDTMRHTIERLQIEIVVVSPGDLSNSEEEVDSTDGSVQEQQPSNND